jgi:DNA gyrase subunit A
LGRNTRGVRGIKLRNDDRVVGMIIVDESHQVLTVTENGFGKRTPVADYRKTNRGGSGIINIKQSERNGKVVGLKGVTDQYDIMLMTKNGIIIRSDVGRISEVGRNTQGVRLISLENGDKVMDIALCEKQPDVEQSAGANGDLAAGRPAVPPGNGTVSDSPENQEIPGQDES